jgi:TolB-like protein/Tfp pilus assembly protein PilF
MFTLRLLGGLSLGSDSGAVTGRAVQKRRLAILCLLAAAPARTLSRDKVIGVLWPESDTEQARHLLSVALYELRKALGEDVIQSRGDDVALGGGMRTDVEAFERALADGALARAVEAYTGPFLDGFYLSDAPEFERWVDAERDRLARRYQGALEKLAQERAAAEDRPGAVDAWRRLSAHDPFNSRIAAGLMEALAAAGDRAGALQHARAHDALLKEELGAGADPEIAALASRIREEPSTGTDGASRPSAPPPPSIAVLPFADLSPALDNQYFSDGLTEEVINALARVDGLQVAARTSTFALRGRGLSVREVGHALRVRTVMEGSVRKAGDRLRITATLVDVESGFQLWGETYDRAGGDVFAVQDELARAVVAALRGRLGERAPGNATLVRPSTPNLDAYTLYLKGRYHWYRRTPDELRQAITYFEQAVARDPTYALAYSGIGDAYALLGAQDYGALPPAEAFPAARRALARALELDPAAAGAHATLGNLHFTYDWDWPAAEREFARALQLDPGCSAAHHWYALGLLVVGRGDEAMTTMRRARELEPLSMVLGTALARVFYYGRRSDRAIEEYRRSLEMDPSFVTAHLGLGLSYVQSGAPAEALEEYHTANRLLGGEQPLVLALIAHAEALLGDPDAARAALVRLQAEARRSYVPPEYLSLVHLGLRDTSGALDALERAFANRSGSMAFLRVDPLLDPLRDEPRFVELVRRVGL